MANFNLPAVPTTPEGGLAGFFRGTQYNYGLADLERQFRDSDLLNQIKQNEYENALKDNPNKEANRATDLLKQAEEQDQYKSGLKNRGAVADVTKKEADVTKINLDNKQTEITQAADALNEFVQVAKAQPIAIMHNWDGYMAELAKNKVKVPEGGYSQQNMDILQARALAAQNSLAQLRAKALADQKFGQDTAIHQMDNASKERVARIQAAAQRDSANAMRPPNPTNEAYALADREFAATGKVSFDTLQRIGEWTIKNDDTLKPKLIQAEVEVLTKSDLYKNKELKPLELQKLAESVVDAKLAANKLQSAYFSTGSKPVSREDLAKIEKTNPGLAKYIKENGKVVGGNEQPQGTPQAASTPTPTQAPNKAALIAKAQATFNSDPDGFIKRFADAEFEGDIEKAKAQLRAEGLDISKASMTSKEYADRYKQGPTLMGKGMSGATPEMTLQESPRNE